MRNFLTLAAAIAALAIPAAAGTITLISLTDPNNSVTNSPNGTSVSLTNGTSADGLSWTNTGASVFNGLHHADVALFGSFTCAKSCNDQFALSLATFISPGTTGDIQVNGTASPFASIDAFLKTGSGGSAILIAQAFGSFTGPFAISSPTFSLGNGGNFSGTFFFNVAMPAGTLDIPQLQTADLLINSVPEPSTIAIVAGSILLLVYVKRLRRA